MLAVVPGAGGGAKKLEEAARLWALGELTTQDHEDRQLEQLDAQFAYWGLQPEGAALDDAPMFHLFPDNVEPWALFLEVQTEWRGSGMQREGLDKAGVERILRSLRVRRAHRQQRLRELRVMEVAALAAWAERAQREG